MKTELDWIAYALIFLLTTTLSAYFIGIFAYPYGFIVITVILILRLTARQKPDN